MKMYSGESNSLPRGRREVIEACWNFIYFFGGYGRGIFAWRDDLDDENVMEVITS